MRWMIRSIKCERELAAGTRTGSRMGPDSHLYLTPFQSLNNAKNACMASRSLATAGPVQALKPATSVKAVCNLGAITQGMFPL